MTGTIERFVELNSELAAYRKASESGQLSYEEFRKQSNRVLDEQDTVLDALYGPVRDVEKSYGVV